MQNRPQDNNIVAALKDKLGFLKPELTKENLLTLVVMAAGGVKRHDLPRYFRYKWNARRQVKSLLETLRKEGVIERDTSRLIKATESWSDLAYAEVGRVLPGGRYAINLWGKPDNTPVSASISLKQLNKHKLSEGDIVLVHLQRLRGFELGGVVIKKSQGDRPESLTGIYNNRSGTPYFEVVGTHIKTRFRLRHDKNTVLQHRQPCSVEVPLDMNLADPHLILMDDQFSDSETGVKINNVLAKKYDLEDEHSLDALAAAAVIKRRRINRKARRDLTDLNLITVDPPGAKDLDDAIFIEKISGGWRKVVCIADVGHYVRAGSTVDHEAFRKGNSVYMPDRDYMMLPGDVTQKCSLLANVDRPVGYVETFYDDEGRLQDEEIGLGVMRSRAQMTYGQFYDALMDSDPAVQAVGDFHDMQRRTVQTRRRKSHEAAELVDQGVEGYVSQSIIETFMVQANSSIARNLSATSTPTLYRNNAPGINGSLYEKTVQELRYLGFAFPDDAEDCNWDVLDQLVREAHAKNLGPRVDQLLINNLLDRAYYQKESRGHFALGLEFYTHATSPIRRYADNIVWRSVRTMLGVDGGLTDQEVERLDDIATHLNERKQLQKDIHSDRKKYHLIRGLRQYQGNAMNAVVVGMDDKSVEIMIAQNGLRNRISADEIARAGGLLDTARHEIVFPANDNHAEVRITRNGRIKGEITKVQPAHALWDFKVTGPG